MINLLETSIKKSIVRLLYYNNTATISELSMHIDKSIPVISNAVAELVDKDILSTSNYANSTGGRKAQKYCLSKNQLFVLCVAMDQLYTTISCIDISTNRQIFSKIFKLDLLNNEKALEELVTSIEHVLKNSKILNHKYIGIGLGMPGFVNTQTGQNQSYDFTHNQTSIRDYLNERFKIPVFIDNDSSTIALGESKFGLAKNKKDVMVLNISWGVGLGMILDHKLFRGNTGYAGEFSHIPISENNILCTCGKKGCLETEATLKTVTQKAYLGLKTGIHSNIQVKDDSIEELAYAIMRAANNGDQYCIELLAEMGYKIGKALAILIHIINPEQILIGGRASEVGRLLLAPIQQALNKYCIPRLMESLELEVSNLKYQAYTIGTTVLVIEGLTNI